MPAVNDDSTTAVHQNATSVKRLQLIWTSDSGDGSVDYNTAIVDGLVYRVTTIPSGTSAPTNLYDLYLKDAQGYDILAAAGENRSSTVVQAVTPDPPLAVSGVLSLDIDAAGNDKSGIVEIYYR